MGTPIAPEPMTRKNTRRLKRALKIRQDCAYCGVSLNYTVFDGSFATLDHIIPRSKGGTDNLENLTISCIRCNQGKANSTNRPEPSFRLIDILPKTVIDTDPSYGDELE